MFERSAKMEDVKQNNTKNPPKYNDLALRSLASFLTTKPCDQYFKLSVLEILTYGFTLFWVSVFTCFLWITPHLSLKYHINKIFIMSTYWFQKLTFYSNLQENVEGKNCDRCKPGFYNLKERNPEGCSECFCFGVSDVCDSLSWPISQVRAPSGSQDLMSTP